MQNDVSKTHSSRFATSPQRSSRYANKFLVLKSCGVDGEGGPSLKLLVELSPLSIRLLIPVVVQQPLLTPPSHCVRMGGNFSPSLVHRLCGQNVEERRSRSSCGSRNRYQGGDKAPSSP